MRAVESGPAVQMAHHVGAEVIGIGRAADRSVAIEAGASTFIDLDDEALPSSIARQWFSTPLEERPQRPFIADWGPAYEWCPPWTTTSCD